MLEEGSLMYAIESQKLTKYYGRARGIIDVDLAVEQGEIFGFIGPNGAGKSTTIKTLLNFVYPTSGSARILGKDCVRESRDVKRDVGYVPPEVEYYDYMTVGELLRYSASFYGLNLNDRARKLAERFDLPLDQRIDRLSTGNKKKTAILQAVLHRPRVLILDEPTSGLDPLMQQRMFELLLEENSRGATIFLSSHILSEVQKICGRVGIIKEGRVIQVEEIRKLRERQLKRVRVEFGHEIDDEALHGALQTVCGLPGVVRHSASGREAELLYGGKPGQLLGALAGMEIENLTVEEPSLEEIFMHYYEEA
jgi:ABC-2 type transport system ATP-binding protein